MLACPCYNVTVHDGDPAALKAEYPSLVGLQEGEGCHYITCFNCNTPIALRPPKFTFSSLSVPSASLCPSNLVQLSTDDRDNVDWSHAFNLFVKSLSATRTSGKATLVDEKLREKAEVAILRKEQDIATQIQAIHASLELFKKDTMNALAVLEARSQKARQSIKQLATSTAPLKSPTSPLFDESTPRNVLKGGFEHLETPAHMSDSVSSLASDTTSRPPLLERTSLPLAQAAELNQENSLIARSVAQSSAMFDRTPSNNPPMRKSHNVNTIANSLPISSMPRLNFDKDLAVSLKLQESIMESDRAQRAREAAKKGERRSRSREAKKLRKETLDALAIREADENEETANQTRSRTVTPTLTEHRKVQFSGDAKSDTSNEGRENEEAEDFFQVDDLGSETEHKSGTSTPLLIPSDNERDDDEEEEKPSKRANGRRKLFSIPESTSSSSISSISAVAFREPTTNRYGARRHVLSQDESERQKIREASQSFLDSVLGTSAPSHRPPHKISKTESSAPVIHKAARRQLNAVFTDESLSSGEESELDVPVAKGQDGVAASVPIQFQPNKSGYSSHYWERKTSVPNREAMLVPRYEHSRHQKSRTRSKSPNAVPNPFLASNPNEPIETYFAKKPVPVAGTSLQTGIASSLRQNSYLEKVKADLAVGDRVREQSNESSSTATTDGEPTNPHEWADRNAKKEVKREQRNLLEKVT